MRKRNCPNCAAPYDTNLNKCPYCETSYYDLSALNLASGEPFYLKIQTEMNGAPCYITQLVRPRADMSMEFGSETAYACDILGRRICSYTKSRTMTTNISFEAIASPTHKSLCTIEIGGTINEM